MSWVFYPEKGHINIAVNKFYSQDIKRLRKKDRKRERERERKRERER